MRTQKYTQVKALVAKYKNLAKNSKAVIDAQKDWEFVDSFHSDIGVNINVMDFEHQMLAHFYFLAAGDSADSFAVKRFERCAECYQSNLLSTEEESFLIMNFDLLIDYLLSNTNSWEIKTLPLDVPNGWSGLVSHLINNKDNVRVFLPQTDKGQELVGLSNCNVVVGKGYQYAVLRSFSTDLKVEKYEGQKNEQVDLWKNLQKGSFDVFIAEIPSFYSAQDEDLSAYLDASYSLVRDGGEMLICFSREELLDKYSCTFRKMITEKQELAEAIELPGERVLLHIVKSQQKSFVMSDASSITRERGWGNGYKEFDIERFLELVAHAELPEFDEKPICRRFDCNLLKEDVFFPAFYLCCYEGECLSSYAEQPADLVATDECTGKEKVVTINNLSHIFSKGGVSIDKLKSVDLSRARKYQRVSGPCVIVAVSPNAIAVGYIVEETSVLVPKNLQVLKTKSKENALFIAAYLLSQEAKDQVCSLVAGKGVSVQICDNWLDLVKVSSLSEEEKLEYVRKVGHSDWQKQEESSQAATIRYKQAIRLRKHALSQNVSSFDSLFRTLELCFEEQGGRLKRNDKISPVSELTVEDAFKNLLGKLDVIRDRVNHIAEDQDWGACESIEPQQFIEDFERNHGGPNFKFTHSWEEYETNCFKQDIFDKKSGKLLFHAGESFNAAWFPKAALIQVLENIVANAQEHGFIDPARKDYYVNFSWKTDGLNLILHISNNGAPIPEDMSTDKIIQYGYSSALNKNGHGGIGGGQISEIMQEFGGNVEVISTPKAKQSVIYVLSMPLASLY